MEPASPSACVSASLSFSYELKKNKTKQNTKLEGREQPGWPSGLALPSAQGVILETRDQVPRWAPCMEPASPSACVSVSLSLSLSVCLS